MLILSIDVGIRNLALCLLDDSDNSIKNWDVSSVPSESDDGLFCALRDHLNERPWTLDADAILIERQPDRNKRIVSVMYFLQSYFTILAKAGARTHLWNPSLKVPDCQGKGTAMYRKRKNTAIERCRAFLEETWAVNGRWVSVFDESKKRDDLADSCLQALSYGQCPPTSEPKRTTPAKVRPRAPTEHQKKSRYSKSNLLWLYNYHKGTAEYEKAIVDNKRFQRDVQRYYKDMDSFISICCV